MESSKDFENRLSATAREEIESRGYELAATGEQALSQLIAAARTRLEAEDRLDDPAAVDAAEERLRALVDASTPLPEGVGGVAFDVELERTPVDSTAIARVVAASIYTATLGIWPWG